jgi:D-alanine transaminase
MSGTPGAVWMDGAIVPMASAHVSVLDRGLLFGESIYEVLPVTGGAPRLVAEHAARMRRNAEAIGLAGDAVPEPDAWSRLGSALASAEGVAEGLLYAQLTGGAAPRAHVPSGAVAPTFFAFVQPHGFPRAARVDAGLRAVTAADDRWARCDLKTTMLLPAVLGKRRALELDAEEVIFVGPGGELREGGSSSVFVVERGGLVGVPPGTAVLPGITERSIERLAAAAGIALAREPIAIERVRVADEVLVASTSFLAMPVVALDGAAIGAGSVGPVAREIARLLRVDLGLPD